MFFYKPFIIGPILFLLYLHKSRFNLGIWDRLLILFLIFQVALLLDCLINNLFYLYVDFDHTLSMANENNNNDSSKSNNNNWNNVPSNRDLNRDPARLIRYLSLNIAALKFRRSASKAIALALVTSANLLVDVISDEEKANFWIYHFNHFMDSGRGGQPGGSPFERDQIAAFPFNFPKDRGGAEGSNFLSDSDISGYIFKLFGDIFKPVEHSIPLDTLVNVHHVLLLCLFIIVLCLILLVFYFFINLLIISNKDYLLNKVKNKYVILYVRYVVFKSKIDIILLGAMIIVSLSFILYVLHYLIVHPIFINS